MTPTPATSGKKKQAFKLFYETETGVHKDLAGTEFVPKKGDEYFLGLDGNVYQMETDYPCCDDDGPPHSYMSRQHHLVAKIVK